MLEWTQQVSKRGTKAQNDEIRREASTTKSLVDARFTSGFQAVRSRTQVKWHNKFVGGHDLQRIMGRDGGRLVWCSQCIGYSIVQLGSRCNKVHGKRSKAAEFL